MDIEQQRNIKYQLLNTEIVLKNYDPEDFQVYSESVKPGQSEDIDAWTVDELKQAIEDFQKQKGQGTKGSRIINIDPDLNFRTQIQCKAPENNKLTDFMKANPQDRVQIKMLEFLVKQEGLFKTNYAAFKIETKPLGWVVWRRYGDFNWLRNVLLKQYPGQLLPPVPGKSVKTVDQDHLEKRMRTMELFLQECLNNEIIRNSQAFVDFLSCEDDKNIKERQTFHDKMAAPVRPADLILPDGVCDIENTPELRNHCISIQDYLKNSLETNTKIGDSFKRLFLDLDNLSTTLKNIGDQFGNLTRFTEFFCKQNPLISSFGTFNNLQTLYTEISGFMNNWYQNIIYQMKNVKDNYFGFFDYHRKMQEQALEFIDKRNSLATKFQEQRTKLNDKKEKLFTQGDTSKWDLPADIPKPAKELQANKLEAFKYMLPNETKALNDLRENFAYMNLSVIGDTCKMMTFRLSSYCVRFMRVAQLRELDMKLYQSHIGEIVNRLATLGNVQIEEVSLIEEPPVIVQEEIKQQQK